MGLLQDRIGLDQIESLRFNVPVVSVLIPVSAPFIVTVKRGIRVRIRVRIIAARIAEALALLTHDIGVVECLRAAEDARGGTLALCVEGPGTSLINRRRHRAGQCIYCVVMCCVVLGTVEWKKLRSMSRKSERKGKARSNSRGQLRQFYTS
jgi:hypothetical protein